MSDVIINSIVEALLPPMEEMIDRKLHQKASEELMEKFLSTEKSRLVFDPPVARGTLVNWEKRGLIQPHFIGGKKYFKYSELLEAIQKIKKYSRQ